MRKLMFVLFALLVFTGCKKEELPKTYDLCEITVTTEYNGNYFSLSGIDDSEIYVTNPEETIFYYYAELTSNPYIIYLKTGKTYVININAWSSYIDDYYYTSTKLVQITDRDSALNFKVNLKKEYFE
jgi:hypothetical protein